MTRVLLIEDNPGDAFLIQDELRSGFDLVRVERLAEALEQLRSGGFDVVLLDLSLPDSFGFDTFRKVHAAAPEVPVVVLTGMIDDDAAAQAMREGAQDWLVKGRGGDQEISRAIRYAIERNRLATRLRELDRGRSLFLSVVSHDLKSPAAAIVAGMDMLLRGSFGELNAPQRRVLELARDNALRQTRLIRDLLDAAVIEAGALSLRRTPLPLDAIVTAEVEEVRPLATERALDLVVDAPSGLTVLVDGDRIAQALQNLVTNAVKFARSRIEVRVRSDGAQIAVVVEDDGSGIDPALLDTLFERFARGPQGGSGLGLSIARGIAEAHGGTVRAANRPEGGARFELVLPHPG
jgi:phosphoserine phosphatase RsbU/P